MTKLDDYDAVQAVTRQIGSMGEKGIEDFVATMSREHRTNQQKFMGLCLAWIHHTATLETGEYDGRNEASVHVARKIVEATTYDTQKNTDGEIWPIRMPLI